MKTFIKKAILYTSVFALAGGASFLLQYKPKAAKKETKEIPVVLTPGERLINSVLGYEAMEVKASVEMMSEDMQTIGVKFDGKGTIRDFENIQVRGDLDLNFGGSLVSADLAYFGKDLAFSFEDNYFKLKTDDILDFVDMIPSYGINVELPEGFQDISLDTIEETILGIQEEDKAKDPTGGYYYTVTFGDLELFVKTDENDNLLGLRTDTIFYEGMKFKLDADLKDITIDKLDIQNPLELEDASKYQDFKPAFNLFDAAMNFVNKDAASINIALDFNKTIDVENADPELKEILSTSVDLGFDKVNKEFSLTGDIYENGRTHSFLAAYKDEAIWASFHKVNVTLNTASIYDVINWAMEEFGNDKLNDLLNGSTDLLSSFDLNDIVTKVKNTLGHISVEEQKLTVNLDLSSFDLETKPFDISLTWEDGELKTLVLHDLTIKNYNFDLTLTFKDYVAPVIEKDIYVSIEPAAPLVSAILDLVKETQFRIEFDAIVDKADPAEKDITFQGGLQFDIDDGFGYGDIDIVDSDSYHHRIKADMFNKDAFFFSYNNTLKGKFTSQTLEDMVTLVKDIVAEPDDHFIELFGDLIDNLEGSPITKVLNGEYGALLAYNIIDNLSITDSKIALDLSLEVVGFDKTLHIEIDYTGNVETEEAKLIGMSISGLELDDAEIRADLKLKSFNPALESSRLSPYDEYLDFSDIKVLLELGLNTSEFNYYHFTATASLKLIGVLLGTTLLNKDVPLDIKVRNEKGDVKVAIEFLDLPIVAIATPNSDYASEKDRKGSIYYYDNTFYVKRTEQVKKKGFLGIGTGSFMTYTLTRVCDQDYFFDNILEILLSDVLSCSDTIMNLVTDSDSTKTGEEQIHYEKLIKDFQYNKDQGYFLADINLAEIAHDDMFTQCTAKIYENKADHILSGIDATLMLNLKLIKIGVTLDLDFVDDHSVAIWTYDENGNKTGDVPGTSLTAFETFVAAHKNDTRNQKFVTVK